MWNSCIKKVISIYFKKEAIKINREKNTRIGGYTKQPIF